jgi:hypothetical protein
VPDIQEDQPVADTSEPTAPSETNPTPAKTPEKNFPTVLVILFVAAITLLGILTYFIFRKIKKS